MGNAPITTETIAATKRANRCQASGTRPSGTGENQIPRARARTAARRDERLPVGGGRGHGVAPSRRTRPSRRTARPWIAPSSAATTYCQVKEYSPSSPS